MKLFRMAASALVGAAILSGCVTGQPSHYTWGNYDGSLYSYYKDPAGGEAYMRALAEIIQTAEKTQKPLAPGLYAEYGYMLMQQKKESEAIAYFSKEKAAWPESTYFMDGMIKNANIGAGRKSATLESASPVLSKNDAAGKKE